MRYRNVRSQDKLLEARFFLSHMHEQAKRFLGSADRNALDHFRYYLSAFVSPSRSVTFTLQSQYRSTHAEDFEKWYEQQKTKLSTFPFLEIRNITQKQGNRVPLIRIEVEGGDGNTYIFTYDPTFHEQEGIIESTIKFGRQTVF